jgi:AAA+ superfamily predicted ATPase
VGKTTTAEGVAQHFQKPLFQITCGDLGSNARDVEAELEKNFTLASRWGCILLLDEADVFLSARERTDFERNGLVAGWCHVNT